MKTTPLAWFLWLLLLVTGASQLPAKPTEADRNLLLTELRAKAEHGDATAQFNLGICYHNGQGVTKDYVEAYKWLSLASVGGNENARGLKSELARQMTPEQIAKGFRSAREFKPSGAPKPGTSDPTR